MKRDLVPKGQGLAPGSPSTVECLLRAAAGILVLQGLVARLSSGLCFLLRIDRPTVEETEPSLDLCSLTVWYLIFRGAYRYRLWAWTQSRV